MPPKKKIAQCVVRGCKAETSGRNWKEKANLIFAEVYLDKFAVLNQDEGGSKTNLRIHYEAIGLVLHAQGFHFTYEQIRKNA